MQHFESACGLSSREALCIWISHDRTRVFQTALHAPRGPATGKILQLETITLLRETQDGRWRQFCFSEWETVSSVMHFIMFQQVSHYTGCKWLYIRSCYNWMSSLLWVILASVDGHGRFTASVISLSLWPLHRWISKSDRRLGSHRLTWLTTSSSGSPRSGCHFF